MIVKELIAKLQEYDEDLPVHLYTDHGQTVSPACEVTLQYVLGQDVIANEDVKYNPKATLSLEIFGE